MRILVDTNLLTRMAEPGHAQNAVAHGAVNRLGSQGHELLIVPQVLYEFWSVCTRPVTANGLGKTPTETVGEIVKIRKLFRLMDETPRILPEWETLVSTLGIIGRNAHDAHLVAAMLVRAIPAILTFNGSDFRRFPGVTIIDPIVTAASAP
jgi:predicted nucleic acid-binding protein